MFEILIFALLYILLNLYVTGRINKSLYLNEERRRLHKKLIWLLPFIGPLLIRGFWKAEKNPPFKLVQAKKKFETITKEDRKTRKGNFYESDKAFPGTNDF